MGRIQTKAHALRAVETLPLAHGYASGVLFRRRGGGGDLAKSSNESDATSRCKQSREDVAGHCDLRFSCILPILGLAYERLPVVCYQSHAAAGTACFRSIVYSWHVRSRRLVVSSDRATYVISPYHSLAAGGEFFTQSPDNAACPRLRGVRDLGVTPFINLPTVPELRRSCPLRER